MQHEARTINEIVRSLGQGFYRLPVFQRPYVWTDEQVLRLLDSLLHGYHVGSLTLWERYTFEAVDVNLGGVVVRTVEAGDSVLVIDGQQRLGALARAFLSQRASFDFTTRSFLFDQEPRANLIPLHWVIQGFKPELFAWCDATPSGLDKWAYLEESLRWRTIPAVRLPHDWTLENVLASYERMNTEGTPMSTTDLRDGLLRAGVDRV